MHHRYIDPLTDFGFKKIFGVDSGKPLLMDLLNQLLPAEHRIVDLTHTNSEALGRFLNQRSAAFDLHCRTADDRRFIIEMQRTPQPHFKDRSVFYSTFPIYEQACLGEWNFELCPVYCIAFLNFFFDKSDRRSDRYIERVQLRNERCEVFYNKLHFIFIQLPLFKKRLEDCSTRLELWVYLLTHIGKLPENPRDLPAPLNDPFFIHALDLAKAARLSEAEYWEYEASLKRSRDEYATLQFAHNKGQKEGVRQNQRDVVLRLIERGGMSCSEIALVAGVDEAYVRELQAELAAA